MRRRIVLAALCMSGLAAAATPSEGVEQSLHRGFWAETDLGAFFTVGGHDRYSNAQTYLQLGVGDDVGEHLEVGVQFGLGASNANCFSAGNALNGTCSQSDNFTMTFVDLSATYLVALSARLYLTPMVLAGYTNLDPAPIATSLASVQAANVGAGVGIEYATPLDHFSLGVDVTLRYVLSVNIPGVAVFPRVKYTF